MEPARTVDSLVKFKYKKKFSFANKNLSFDEEKKNSEESDYSVGEEEEEETEEEKPAKNKWKGSARLKIEQSESEESSDDSRKKKNKKRERSKKNSDEKEVKEEITQKFIRKFPHHSSKLIRKTLSENNFELKKSIERLLREKAENNGVGKEKSFEIEEWSDGDESIRQKNLQSKQKKTDVAQQLEEIYSEFKDYENNGNSLKDGRKVIIESDDDDDEDQESSSNSNQAPSESLEEKAIKLKSKKKLVIASSSENEDENEEEKEEVEESEPKKKKKKSKDKKHKKKKEKKKNKAAVSEESNEDQDDDEFENSYGSDDSEGSNGEEILSDNQKTAILSLFNDASMEDIQSMINISTKRLKTLLSLRPFQDFKDLKSRLSQRSLLPVIQSAKDIIYARSIVNSLLARCEKISQKMEKQVATLIESNESNNQGSSSALEIKFQPKNLNKNLSLKPYQLIGLNWLCLMHKENINAILADEMGLGKTCQTIAFLAHLLETSKKSLHLIIVPPSTLDNWIREISTWCPDFVFTVYQGGLDERRTLRYDILHHKFAKPLNALLTTYGLISSTNEDKAFFKKIHFDYVVFDEAHMLKNMNSIRYQSLIKIRSKHKLLLTGTPLQNNLVELMSLLYFVMPDIFHHKTEYLNKIFASKPSNVDTDTFYNEKIAQAKGIMKPFILRRLKSDVLKQLPKKIIEVIYCDMSHRQAKEYTNLISYYKKRKDELIKEASDKAEAKRNKSDETKNIGTEILELMGPVGSRNPNIEKKKLKPTEDSSSNILMELRKAANHPLLRRCLYDDQKIKQMAKLILKESSPDTVLEYVIEDLSVMSDFQIHKTCFLYKCLKGFELDNKEILGSGKFAVLSSLLEEKKESGDRILIFSQFVIMLDIMEDFLKIKNYKFFRLDGSTAVSERQDMIDAYNNDSEVFIFLLSTKAGGVGINLTAANVVILHDIDYNPFNDKQAEDRCHRVGQTKEVQVYKLISKETIDETMLKIQQRKLELGAEISGENDEGESKTDMISMLREALKI